MSSEGGGFKEAATADKAKRTASFITDVRAIAVAVIAVAATVFFAGVYYRDARAQIDEYKNRIDTAERQISETNTQLKDLKTSVNAQFLKLVTDIVNSGGIIENREGNPSGGGLSPTVGPGRCPPGTFVVGIQPFKDPHDVRQINFQCGILPKLEVK